LFKVLLLLFIIVPAIEMWGLITVGRWIGALPTIGLVILTGVLGAWLAKQQGLQVARLVQLQLARGEMPTDALLDGILVLSGAILLLTPGFVTDTVGFLLLFPYTRAVIRHGLKQWIRSLIASGKITLLFRR